MSAALPTLALPIGGAPSQVRKVDKTTPPSLPDLPCDAWEQILLYGETNPGEIIQQLRKIKAIGCSTRDALNRLLSILTPNQIVELC